MRAIKQVFLALVLCFCTMTALAASDPQGLVQTTSNDILASLKKLKAQGKLKARNIAILVNRDLIPHVDADQMAMAVVGRQYWNKATSAQKQAFIREFKRLVINTYAAAFASYNDDKVKVYPLRTQPTNYATVKTLIMRPNGQKIAVNYNLSKNGSGWKVTDFNIENISITQNYRAQFASVLRQYGLAGLTERLAKKNKRF